MKPHEVWLNVETIIVVIETIIWYNMKVYIIEFNNKSYNICFNIKFLYIYGL